jgi:hypothetical protein
VLTQVGVELAKAELECPGLVVDGKRELQHQLTWPDTCCEICGAGSHVLTRGQPAGQRYFSTRDGSGPERRTGSHVDRNRPAGTREHGARAIHEPRPLLGVRETAAKVAHLCECEGG